MGNRQGLPAYGENTGVAVKRDSRFYRQNVALSLPVGDYTLRLSTNIPHRNNAEAKHRPYPSGNDPKVREVVEVPFSVKPLDSEKMKLRVEKLYRGLGRETDIHTVRTMAYDIGTLPPEFARRAWRTLLFDKKIPGIKRDAIAQMPSAQATREMPDVLLEVQYSDPIRDEDGKILTLLNYLTRMYNNSDVGENRYLVNNLHKYIRDKTSARRNSLFSTPIIIDGPAM
ncbi:MAG: hypothetical protein H7Y38_20695 [Armatimonadetes bacterium]|nr:hypothetical protein [Armatimonadota bacterium]